jgi:hypothetical protein
MRVQRIELLFSLVLGCSLFFANIVVPAERNIQDHEENKNCITCHVESDFSLSNASKPIWINKTETVEFDTYSRNHLTSQDGFPSGESKLCLGCHDGLSASDDKNIYFSSEEVLNNTISLSSHNNHPISILYNSASSFKNKSLADPSMEPSGLGGTIEEDLLEDGKIVCTSCHDIHQMKENEFSSNNHFIATDGNNSISMKISNRNSALCLTCHKK